MSEAKLVTFSLARQLIVNHNEIAGKTQTTLRAGPNPAVDSRLVDPDFDKNAAEFIFEHLTSPVVECGQLSESGKTGEQLFKAHTAEEQDLIGEYLHTKFMEREALIRRQMADADAALAAAVKAKDPEPAPPAATPEQVEAAEVAMARMQIAEFDAFTDEQKESLGQRGKAKYDELVAKVKAYEAKLVGEVGGTEPAEDEGDEIKDPAFTEGLETALTGDKDSGKGRRKKQG